MHNAPLLPDVFIMIMTIIIWLSDIITGKKGQGLTYVATVTSALISSFWYAVVTIDPYVYHYFYDMYVVDPFSSLMKLFISLGFAVSLIYSRQYIKERNLSGGDFYLLALFSLLGQLVMVSGNNFLTLYLGLELTSLSLYALIALRRNMPQSTEAAIKYCVLGALSSGFLLYGISMIYGETGSFNLNNVSAVITSGSVNHTALLFGVVFIVTSISFKIGIVPFHMWVPDVYSGAPTAITLLVGGIAKVSVFAWVLRFLMVGLLPLAVDWQMMLAILAALSLIVGNIAGIVQHNVKRMLAYSAISNMGFLMLGLISGVIDGKASNIVNSYGSAVFYSITYMLPTLGAFGVIILLARYNFEADTLDDFKGLNKRSRLFAFVMLSIMLSLAGIPPAVGFYAKFAVLQAAINANLTWLAVLAVIASLSGAFYYLRIIKLMYFNEPVDKTPIVSYVASRVILICNGFIVLLLGVFPGPLMSSCLWAVRQTLSFNGSSCG
ncbi:NADH-quinone oxidoreductase subunit NuoN [Candidatus Vallotia lariciata]|uniref:NADH-quinone oxidoreductase subunit NuoN n=1 Tax=Candidatus Vallotia laricis TaxID=2018052 RepID=UPI001D006EC0|nr:NADH-quinone oxidoreductase subunit NuoN [Candidatus Vallotia lariciata]UDG82948.1 NAD(P)H-quinone oxidoreductase subunit 2, chloroplastic [Candidatus Vallotia lariciata]